MIRNVCKEDLDVLGKLFGKTFKEEDVDFELSMLDEVDEEIFSVFLVGVYRIPYEIGADKDDEFFYHEVLGVYTKDENDESLNRVFYETCAATNKVITFWIPWSEIYEKMLSPAFIKGNGGKIKHLFCIAFSNNLKSKYKGDTK